MNARFDRNIRFFGAEGQNKLRQAVVAIVGVGGLGQHVVQQLAFLGVGTLILIDDEDISDSNLNRYVFARHDDPIPGTKKVDIAKRAIELIDPTIKVICIPKELRTHEAFDALLQAHTIFGCLDNDGARVVLNDLCLAYGKSFFDLASDTENSGKLRFGGRIAHSGNDSGCLVCMDLLDLKAATDQLASPLSRQDKAKIYGVDISDLDEVGPSVVSLNGIIASLAVNEFMLDLTGIRPANSKLEYRGNIGIVTVQKPALITDCYACNCIRNALETANLDRYLLNQN